MKTETVKGTYVATVRTSVTPQALRATLRDQLAANGIDASEHSLTALVAMSAHETGEWASCWNYNLGNVKASPTWEGEFVCLNNVWEVLKGVTRWFSPRGETVGKGGPLKGEEWAVGPGHPQTRFRAYRTLAEGTVGFVEKMVGKYRPSLDVLLKGGSTDDFVAALKRQNYFTGDLEKYQISVRRFYKQFAVTHVPMPVGLPTLKLGDEGVAVAALQCLLNAGGTHGSRLKPDGKFGPKTHTEVSFYSPNGVVEEAAWHRIVEHSQT